MRRGFILAIVLGLLALTPAIDGPSNRALARLPDEVGAPGLVLNPGSDAPTVAPGGPATGPRNLWKLDSSLQNVEAAHRREGETKALSLAHQLGFKTRGNRLRIIVQASDGNTPNIRRELRGLGAAIEMEYNDYVQALIPVSRLADLHAMESLRYATQAAEAQPMALSEGVNLSGANSWHSAGINGSGVKVAIIDGGFSGYASKLGSDLPASVTTANFRADGDFFSSDHGTKVAETVFDMAPGAQMYLVAVDTTVSLGNAVNWAISQGIQVVNHSRGYPAWGSGDGTGPVNSIVTNATNSGTSWVNASGNSADRHWGGAMERP